MKDRIRIINGIFLLLIISLTGCKKDSGEMPDFAAKGTIQALVNNSQVITKSIITRAIKSDIDENYSFYTIQGSTGGREERIFIFSLTDISVGTFPIGGEGNDKVKASFVQTRIDTSFQDSIIVTSWEAPYGNQVVGQLNIIELSDEAIKGKFEYQASNKKDKSTIEVKSGSFNIELKK